MTATVAAVGWSADADAAAAGRAAARLALMPLDGRPPRCAIVFGSAWYNQPALLEGVRGVLGQIPLVGGSTAGEIVPDGPRTHSCAVLALASDEVSVSVGSGRHVGRDPRTAGHEAAYQSLQGFNGDSRKGFLLFGDGLAMRYVEVFRGLREVLGTSFLCAGGLMADELQFRHTSQYTPQGVVSDAVVGLLLGGECAIGVGLEHGFSPISKPRRITRSRANVLQELDGHPASSVYEEYFGADLMTSVKQTTLTRQLIAYPLGIRLQLDASTAPALRTIMAFGPDGSLVCTGEVPEGAWVQLMIGSKALALEAAAAAAQAAIRPLRRVRFALVFISAVRKRLLGHAAPQEVAAIRRVLGQDVPFVGCYTYGEQASLHGSVGGGDPMIQTGSCLVIAVGS